MIYRHLLKEAGMKKSDLAKHLGVDPGTVSRWGDSPPEYVMWGLENYVNAKQAVDLRRAMTAFLGSA